MKKFRPLRFGIGISTVVAVIMPIALTVSCESRPSYFEKDGKYYHSVMHPRMIWTGKMWMSLPYYTDEEITKEEYEKHKGDK